MALVLSQDEAMLVDSTRGLLSREAPVTAFRALRDSGAELAYEPALLAKLAENGLVAPNVPEADGGLGLGAAAAGLVLQQAGHVLAAAPLLSAAISTALIARAGDEGQRADLLQLHLQPGGQFGAGVLPALGAHQHQARPARRGRQ